MQTASASAPQIGRIVQEQRKNRKLTLEQLSTSSGVSRSMLSQIERGQANPTFAVVWRLTRALGMSLSDLAPLASETSTGRMELLTAAGTPEIRNTEGTCRMRILSPPRLAGQSEWYLIDIDPGGALISEAHAKGAWEHLTPLEGALTVSSGEQTFQVEEAGTARYPADVPHMILNEATTVARGLLVTLYPASRKTE